MAIMSEKPGPYVVRRPLYDIEEVPPVRYAPNPNSNVLGSSGTYPQETRGQGKYIVVHYFWEFLDDVVGVACKRNSNAAGGIANRPS